MKINKKKIEEQIELGYIRVQKHSKENLFIYNYTQKCQIDGAWNDETTLCRGLILDDKDRIIALPFAKFFNLAEYKGDVPKIKPRVLEKYDGSLGILYWIRNEPYLATRGSFSSEQALFGTKLLHTKYKNIWNELKKYKDKVTLLFEIVYPQNRIVVDYGEKEELVFLGAKEIQTGNDIEIGVPKEITTAKEYDFNGIDSLPIRDNAEGYVLYRPNNLRLKIKFDEYVRLHRIVTGVTKRRIWDMLRNGDDISELTNKVPEEFSEWVNNTVNELKTRHDEIISKANNAIKKYKYLEKDRKESAIHIMKNHQEISSIIFSILSGKEYEKIVWKMLKPKAENPFKEEI